MYRDSHQDELVHGISLVIRIATYAAYAVCVGALVSGLVTLLSGRLPRPLVRRIGRPWRWGAGLVLLAVALADLMWVPGDIQATYWGLALFLVPLTGSYVCIMTSFDRGRRRGRSHARVPEQSRGQAQSQNQGQGQDRGQDQGRENDRERTRNRGRTHRPDAQDPPTLRTTAPERPRSHRPRSTP